MIPAIGLWLQSRQSRRELTLKHEEIIYQRRLELALKVSKTCYEYMAVNHRLKNEKDKHQKTAYLMSLKDLGKQIQEHESQIVMLFPTKSVAAFKTYWRLVDEIRASPDIHWTIVGSRLDQAYSDLTNSLRSDLGVESIENSLIQVLRQD